MKKVLIITPVFGKDSSGAAVYYGLLKEEFEKKGYDICVISEHGAMKGRGLYGIFPPRASRDKYPVLDYLNYFIQNIIYFFIPFIIIYEKPDHVICHSSFYNHPGAFGFVMSITSFLTSKSKYYLDVRDNLMPKRKFFSMSKFEKIFFCSDNIFNRLKNIRILKNKLFRTDVIQEKIRIDNCEQKKFLKEKKLLNKKYLYYGGLIKESKNVDVLLRSFNHYVRHKIDDLYLVVSGLIKTNNIELIGLLNSERVIYLGNLKRNEVLMVIKGAQVCVNISDNEGLPRFCLESIALEKKVVLPKNVPEFEAYYYNNIAFEFDEKSVAEKILSVYENEMAVNYPIDRHFSQNVVERYLSVFEDK